MTCKWVKINKLRDTKMSLSKHLAIAIATEKAQKSHWSTNALTTIRFIGFIKSASIALNIQYGKENLGRSDDLCVKSRLIVSPKFAWQKRGEISFFSSFSGSFTVYLKIFLTTFSAILPYKYGLLSKFFDEFLEKNC